MNINLNSLKNICGNSNQVMVYGWNHCLYKDLRESLNENYSNVVKKAFNYKISYTKKALTRRTSEGRLIEQIPTTKNTKSRCKTGILDLILENYKRKKENLPLISLLFCYDATGNPFKINHETIASRSRNFNKLVTNSELRRCYKLVALMDSDDTILKDVGNIAKETIKLVKINEIDDEVILEKLTPFWEHPDWKKLFETRQNAKCSKTKNGYWKQELTKRIDTYNKKHQTKT